MERQSAPSPQSEAVANDLQELSLQSGSNGQVDGPRPNNPQLGERKNVLQLKLQQRRTREELVNQGIMPPLKSPASFHEQRRSLERARTEDYLKRKIRCRPERSELVRMHILEETSAEPSLQAKQLKLKRARLADDLNEKISQRPGPMELVVKNILPVETSIKEVIIDVDYTKVADSSSFDEDSSDALSPEQPASQESQGSVPSPAESRTSEATPALSPTQTITWVQLGSDQTEKSHPSEFSQNAVMNLSNGPSTLANKSFTSLIKHNQSKSFYDKTQRTKKIKESKPKVKKLKYHQYIPPDQKHKGATAMDSTYAKILQQQQLFLQLQILNQQQHHQHYNYQTILPAPPKAMQDQQTTAITSTTTTVQTLPTISISTHAVPNVFRPNNNTPTVVTKIGPLPYNLDDMKVAELKQELKQRGLHVSGTKVDLIERLKATQDPCTPTSAHVKSAVQQPKPSEALPAVPNICSSSSAVESSKLSNLSSTPPCSPCPSEVSVASMDEVYADGDSFSGTISSPVNQITLLSSSAPLINEKSEVVDKDVMLREKDRQIEELTRRLKQKQDLVERLKQQLEKEKKIHSMLPCDDQNSLTVKMKKEPVSFTCDSIESTASLEKLAPVKSEIVMHTTCQQEQQTFTDSLLKRDEMKSSGSQAQLLFTVNSPSPGLPDDHQPVMLQTMTTSSPLQTDNFLPKAEVLLAQPPPQSSNPTLQMGPCTILSFAISSNVEPFMNINVVQKQPPDNSKDNLLGCSQEQVVPPRMASPHTEPAPPQDNFLPPPEATKATPENGETIEGQPGYSEGGQPSEQQLDDFFDVLIHNLDLTTECKEFLVPCLKQTSPIPESAVPQNELPSAPSSVPDQLENFLETSVWTQLLGGEHDGATMPLIDDLHSQMLSSLAILDQPSSPMDTSDMHFSTPERDTIGLDMSEPPLNGMDWLEPSGPPAMNLTPLSTTTPSVFSTDFLDNHEMHLHWDSCL